MASLCDQELRAKSVEDNRPARCAESGPGGQVACVGRTPSVDFGVPRIFSWRTHLELIVELARQLKK